MKNYIKKIYQLDTFPFVVYTLINFVFFLSISYYIGDDPVFRGIMQKKGFWDGLNHIITTFSVNWSSRWIVNPTAIFFIGLPLMVWRIVNTLMFTLIAYSISKIFIKENNRTNNILICIFLLIFPYKIVANAGWIATTVSYLWPISLGLFCCIAVKKVFYDEKIKRYEYALSGFACVFASNCELLAPVLFVFFAVFVFYFILTKKSFLFTSVLLLITSSNLLFALISGGNSIRYQSEISKWYPNYEMITKLERLYVGFTATFSHLLTAENFTFIVVAILMWIAIYQKYPQNKFYVSIAFYPVLYTLFYKFSILSNLFVQKRVGGAEAVFEIPHIVEINGHNFDSASSYLPTFCSVLFIFIFSICLYLIFENTLKFILVLMLFSGGLLSRIVMGFSPTVYASGTRTFVILYFSVIIIGLLVFLELKNSSEKMKTNITYFIGVCASLTYLAAFLQ